MSSKRFRVAFSFADEKRDFVGHVAAVLARRFGPSAIFYDRFHEAELARPALGSYLPEIYRKQSDLVVVVAAPAYDKKSWAGLEWTGIRNLLKERGNDEIMLCRFGGAQLQGMSSRTGFVELDHKSPSQTATLILERLALNEDKPRDYYSGGADSNGASRQKAIPNNLPSLPHFFGREKELSVIENALAPDARTWGVLIDGPGGIGKTSLAIRAAQLASPSEFHRVIFLSAKESYMSEDGSRRLSDSVLPGYLEILNEIGLQLGLQDVPKAPADERPALIMDYLKERRVLLIVDNMETLRSEHRDQLYSFLSRLPQGCKAIVTSRRRTDIDARIVRLEKLDRDSALAYLSELSKTRPILRHASEAERVQLYEETGGSPLFMRWIVAQLGRGNCLTIASALKFLRRAPSENDPLEFAFGDLLETFTTNETKVLAALTHFTAPVEVKFIAELGACSKVAAQTALNDLANRALIVPDEEEKKYALVPMVASFLRKARPDVIAETGNRLEHAAYALIVENGYEEYDRFGVLDSAWPTVAPALALFLAGPNSQLQTICTALDVFLEFTGRWDEWLSLSQQAEVKALAAHDYESAGWRANNAGWVHQLRAQADGVLECAKRATAHWQKAKVGARERAIAIRLRGIGHQLKQDYPAAICAFREALELGRGLATESQEVGAALTALAGAELDSGDFSAGERDLREALRVTRAVGDTEGVTICNGNLAALALSKQSWAEAESLSRETLPAAVKLGREELIAANSARLAQALARQGKSAEALPHALRAVEIYTKLNSPALAAALAVLAECENQVAVE